VTFSFDKIELKDEILLPKMSYGTDFHNRNKFSNCPLKPKPQQAFTNTAEITRAPFL